MCIQYFFSWIPSRDELFLTQEHIITWRGKKRRNRRVHLLWSHEYLSLFLLIPLQVTQSMLDIAQNENKEPETFSPFFFIILPLFFIYGRTRHRSKSVVHLRCMTSTINLRIRGIIYTYIFLFLFRFYFSMSARRNSKRDFLIIFYSMCCFSYFTVHICTSFLVNLKSYILCWFMFLLWYYLFLFKTHCSIVQLR